MLSHASQCHMTSADRQQPRLRCVYVVTATKYGQRAGADDMRHDTAVTQLSVRPMLQWSCPVWKRFSNDHRRREDGNWIVWNY